MGACISSSDTISLFDERSRRSEELQTIFMTMALELKEHQEQMIRDDPIYKVLLDRIMDVQQRIVEATRSGDQDSLEQARNEVLELQRNPKFFEIAVPRELMQSYTEMKSSIVMIGE